MMTESVLDYPRPPRLEASVHRIRVVFAGQLIAETKRACRVLETYHPPCYYIPREDVREEYLVASTRSSFCEFKGSASYWSVRVDDRVSRDAAWSYETPVPPFEPIRGYLAFYPSRVDECWVDDELVEAQPGDFYGGWITSWITGPIKGGPGTRGW